MGDLFGKPGESRVGRRDEEWITGEGCAELLATEKKAFETRQMQTVEYTAPRAHGPRT